MTIREALAQGTARLESAGVPDARLDAELLLAHVLHEDRLRMRLDGARTLAGAQAQRYEERIETYRQADEKLAGSISYDDAYKVLKELLAEHDEEASQHRTDLAEYSAKKGGYKMAASLMDDAKQQLAEAKAQVEEGKKQLAEKEV